MPLDEFFKLIKDKPIEDYVVKLRYRYSFEDDWTYSNEILEWDPDLDDYEWCNDWYEGYDEIEVLGYIAVVNVNVPNNLKEE